MRTVATLTFRGTLDPARFIDFAEHRASRLDLHARLDDASPQAVTMTVAGEADLIDAFEIACSLGPAGCLVRDFARLPSRGAERGK